MYAETEYRGFTQLLKSSPNLSECFDQAIYFSSIFLIVVFNFLAESLPTRKSPGYPGDCVVLCFDLMCTGVVPEGAEGLQPPVGELLPLCWGKINNSSGNFF